MQHQNICKFVSTEANDRLTVSCFILESSHAAMQTSAVLKTHRIVLVTQGSGTLCINDTAFPVSTGTLAFVFRGERFSANGDTHFEYLYLHFDGTRGEELFRRFGISPIQRIFSDFDGLIPLWHESLSRASEQTIDLVAESMLLYTFSRLDGQIAARNTLLNAVIALSEANFTDPTLSLSSVAETLGYNVKYLSHAFKEKMGIPYSEYLRTLRIKYAVSLFDHGIDSVKNVALLSGFHDPLYFSTVFKKAIGVSPKEYRTQLITRNTP